MRGAGRLTVYVYAALFIPFLPTAGSAIEVQSDAPLRLPSDHEARVPGGMKALAGFAEMSKIGAYQDFFQEFCQTLVRENSPGVARGIPNYFADLRTYMASIAELERLGEKGEHGSVVTVSLTSERQRRVASRILTLVGWKLDGDGSIEPGAQASDGPNQRVPALLGIDEIAMQQTLAAGQTFQFTVPAESARLIGGQSWSQFVLPGDRGIAEAFVRDSRLAKTYAGLSDMGTDAATALISGIGLRTLVTEYADLLARFGEAFTISSSGAAVPGSEEAWKKLAGASPRDAPAFFRALFQRDKGSLAAFYLTLWQADSARQRFFTATPTRAERFYAWYRDSGEPRWSMVLQRNRWRTTLLEHVPLNAAGQVRYPGGRRAWTEVQGSDEDVLLKLPSLAAMVPVARVEARRGAPLDETSVHLMVQNYADWRALFPYFEKLPALGRGEYESMAVFTRSVAGYRGAQRNAILGEWYSLVELIGRGVQAGSLSPAQSAQVFRRVCEGLASRDHSSKAVSALRDLVGGDPDVRTSIASRLLRLPAERRAGFDRVLALQNVPQIDANADSSTAVTALSGLVYAATLDPDGLLINEDPNFLSKHRFEGQPDDDAPSLFNALALTKSNTEPGSYLSGGFMNVDQLARELPSGGQPSGGKIDTLSSEVLRSEPTLPAPPSFPSPADAAPADLVFRTNARLVEVYATVTDSRGRYIDELTAGQFAVLDQRQSQPILGFESRSAEVSVALLLDVTGSMHDALPALKNAALKLIGDLRASDWVAIYGFNSNVSELQSFTRDKNAAKRAVLHTMPFGETALYDALARVNRDLAGRSGKKVVVVFTDGDDNASTITAQAAIRRAKAAGVPVYTIAQGAALFTSDFLKQLSGLSQATGGMPYAIHSPGEIRSVFERVSQDLTHSYFFAFRPAPGETVDYRPIQVQVHGTQRYKVRSREGYYP
jgi:Ca-activated chloride channel family protein